MGAESEAAPTYPTSSAGKRMIVVVAPARKTPGIVLESDKKKKIAGGLLHSDTIAHRKTVKLP